MAATGPMFWIGGTPGSGKSTVAWRLAHELDLPLHPIDAYTYDHEARLGHRGLTLDQALAQGPVAAADEFERGSARRRPVVFEDVAAAGVGGIPTLVEGPQLHPRAVAEWSPIASIWLVTTPERTRAAREARLASSEAAAGRRLTRLVERDGVIGARLAAAAAELDLPVLQVVTDVRWEEVTAAVRAVVVAALDGLPRLRPGPELAARRRHENEVAFRQVAAHEQQLGVVLPPFPYSCTCGRRGCDDVQPATTAERSR